MPTRPAAQPQIVVAEEAHEGAGEGLRVVRGDQEAHFTVWSRLGGRRCLGRDDRQTDGHGLQEDDTESLLTGGEAEHVGARQLPPDPVEFPERPDESHRSVIQTKRRDKPPQTWHLGPISHDSQADVRDLGQDARHRAHEGCRVFPAILPGDADNGGVRGRGLVGTFARPLLDVDSLGDDPHAFRIQAVRGDRHPTTVPARDDDPVGLPRVATLESRQDMETTSIPAGLVLMLVGHHSLERYDVRSSATGKKAAVEVEADDQVGRRPPDSSR